MGLSMVETGTGSRGVRWVRSMGAKPALPSNKKQKPKVGQGATLATTSQPSQNENLWVTVSPPSTPFQPHPCGPFLRLDSSSLAQLLLLHLC